MNPLHQAAFNLGAFFGAARDALREGDAELAAMDKERPQAAQPEAPKDGQKEEKMETGRETTEERPAPGVILRRTIVEEIVLEPGADPEVLKKFRKE